jgi:hypothetical protein
VVPVSTDEERYTAVVLDELASVVISPPELAAEEPVPYGTVGEAAEEEELG